MLSTHLRKHSRLFFLTTALHSSLNTRCLGVMERQWMAIAFLVSLLLSFLWVNQRYILLLFIVNSIYHSSSIMNASWTY